jgi:hypothetical protein
VIVLVAAAALGAAVALFLFYQVNGLQGEAAAADRAAASPLVLSTDRIDFGEIPLDRPVTRRLVVRNNSDRLILARIEVDDSIYSVSPQRLVLEPGTMERITVVASPDQPGDLLDELRIVTDGQPDQPAIIALTGHVSAGDGATGVANGRPPPAGATPGARRELMAHSSAIPLAPVKTTLTIVPEGTSGGSSLQPSAAGQELVAGSVVLTGDAGQPASSTPGQAGEGEAGGSPSAAAAGGGSQGDAGEAGAEGRGTGTRTYGNVTVRPYDPATSTPLASLSEPAPAIPDEILPQEKADAPDVPSKIRERDTDAGGIPEDLDEGDPLDQDPIVSPTLSISAVSTVTLFGRTTRFSPQDVGVLGTDLGGPWSLMQPIQFPLISYAFGETMMLAQSGAASGTFDPATGQVNLQIPIDAIDSLGRAAPLLVPLTSGTTYVRNDAGIVVALTGDPRAPDSGLVRLVGAGQIPYGYNNAAARRVIFIEILAALRFGTTISSISNPGAELRIAVLSGGSE